MVNLIITSYFLCVAFEDYRPLNHSEYHDMLAIFSKFDDFVGFVASVDEGKSQIHLFIYIYIFLYGHMV